MNRARAAAGLVGTALEHLHLRARRLDTSLSQAAFEYFVVELDPDRLLLHREDVESLRTQFSTRMARGILTEDLSLATAAAKLLQRRIGEAIALVGALGEPRWAREGRGTLQTDVSRRRYVRSTEALRQRWRRVLRLAWFRRLLGTANTPGQDDGDAQTAVVAEIIDALERRRRVTPAMVATWQVNAVAATFDPHTALLPPAAQQRFEAMASQQLEGVGVVLDHGATYPRVSYIVPGSPSWLQGDVRVGDQLIAVAERDGEYRDLASLSLTAAARTLRGPVGTTVRLLLRTQRGERRRVRLTRGVVESATGRAQGALVRPPGTAQDRPTFGLVTLPMFYRQIDDGPPRSAALDVRRLISTLNQAAVDGLILDLRGNGGGVLEEAVAVAGLFLDGGPIVQLERFRDTPRVLDDPSMVEDFTGPMVVLVDRGSASASEIVAAALQDYRRAVVVGALSYGKGTAQMLLPLDPLLDDRRQGLTPIGALKITRSQFYRVSGKSTQRLGVTPDVLLPAPFVPADFGERAWTNALPHTTTTALAWRPRSLSVSTSHLAQRSRARVARSEAFKPIVSEASVRTQLSQDTLEPMDFDDWFVRRHSSRRALSAARGPSPRPELVSVNPVGAPGDDDAPEPQAIYEARQVWRERLSKDPWVEESTHILMDLLAPTHTL